MMNALVIGCGSIGQRHINNLLELKCIKKVSILTQRKDCLRLFRGGKNKLEVVKGITGVKADFALICNPTYKHMKTAMGLAKGGVHLFIEKPLSHDLNKAFELRKVVRSKRIQVAVGYNLRFLEALGYIRNVVASGALGQLYFARIEVGQYLPDWRIGADYKASYSARKKMGGGVSLDLSHEIDYMRYIFGDPIAWKAIKTRVSRLKIDSDDVFEGIYLYRNNFVCSVHMDYLEPRKRRCARIVAEKGVVSLDLTNAEIRVERSGKKELVVKNAEYFDIHKTYRDELNDFINSVKTGKSPRVTIDDGIKALELTRDKHV